MTNDEVGEKVAKIYKQQFQVGEVEGPNRFGPYVARRVWTRDDRGEYHAHYAVEYRDELETFDDFAPFATWLSGEFDAEAEAARAERRIRTLVAATLVLGGFALLAFLAINDPRTDFPIGYLVTTLIGGAAGYMFGNWSKAPAANQPLASG